MFTKKDLDGLAEGLEGIDRLKLDVWLDKTSLGLVRTRLEMVLGIGKLAAEGSSFPTRYQGSQLPESAQVVITAGWQGIKQNQKLDIQAPSNFRSLDEFIQTMFVDQYNRARDTRVKSDISQISMAVESYYSGNEGQYPANLSVLVGDGPDDYLTRLPTPPTEASYNSYTYLSNGKEAAAFGLLSSPEDPNKPIYSYQTSLGGYKQISLSEYQKLLSELGGSFEQADTLFNSSSSQDLDTQPLKVQGVKDLGLDLNDWLKAMQF